MNFGSFQLHVQRPDMQGLFDEHAQRVEIDLRRTTCQVNSRVDSGIGLIPPEARAA